jgi:hypothetical protein
VEYSKCNETNVKKLIAIGQTGRNFKTRREEYLYNINRNDENSEYCKQILDTTHTLQNGGYIV